MNKYYLITIAVINLLLLTGLFITKNFYTKALLKVDDHIVNQNEITTNLPKMVNIDIFKDLRSPYVITFMDMKGCPACVQKEIEILSDSSITVIPNYFLIIKNAEKSNYNDIHKSVQIIDYQTWVEQTSLQIKYVNPVSILIDNNFIYDYRFVDTSKPFNKKLTDAYYSFLRSFFDNNTSQSQ